MYFPYSFKIVFNVQMRHSQGTLPIASLKTMLILLQQFAIVVLGKMWIFILAAAVHVLTEFTPSIITRSTVLRLLRLKALPSTTDSSRQQKFNMFPFCIFKTYRVNNDNLKLETDWKFDCDGSSKVKVSKRFLFYIQWIRNKKGKSKWCS